jgi:MFS superfamily sulfate permease-like transporter
VRVLVYDKIHTLTCTGAVGVSLFLLGLEIPFPPFSPHLSFNTLFGTNHLPLLAASLLPALFISLTARVGFFFKDSSKLTKHPLYMPTFCFGIAAVFWIVVAARGDTDMETLASSGWLFSTKTEHRNPSTIKTADWNYWALFDLHRVDWTVLPSIIGDMALLVAIGALSLPIFALAAATELNVPEHNMNHELIGHGVANIFTGGLGGLPAMMVCHINPSTTPLITRRSIQTPESSIVQEEAAMKPASSRL